MILPNKYLTENDALIGVGSILLGKLSTPKPLSTFWEEVKDISNVGNFERFVLGLDLLFVLGLIEIKNNKIVKMVLS
jgi:hypothetical protein